MARLENSGGGEGHRAYKRIDVRAILFDTETTALISNRMTRQEKQPEVVEFYGCLADIPTGEVLEELDVLIKPRLSNMSEKITKITGITDEMLEDKPTFPQVSSSIQDFMEKAPTVIAHNLAFDTDVLDVEYERMGKKFKWPADKICTVEQTLHLLGRRITLGDLHEMMLGEKLVNAHRARNDVLGLLRVCTKLYERGLL
jgi:DNA polymerase-3 subunit alpha (Gram-positive type)